MKLIKALSDAIDLSLDGETSGVHFTAEFEIEVDGKTWNVYTVSISHRDILAYCDRGTATFLVDSYGDRNTAELFNWETE